MSNISSKSELDYKQLSILDSEMEKVKKSKVIAVLLWFFLGGLGVHRIYVGDLVYGLAMGLSIVFLALITGGISVFITWIWLLIDLFFVLNRVEEVNNQAEEKIIREMNLKSL